MLSKREKGEWERGRKNWLNLRRALSGLRVQMRGTIDWIWGSTRWSANSARNWLQSARDPAYGIAWLSVAVFAWTQVASRSDHHVLRQALLWGMNGTKSNEYSNITKLSERDLVAWMLNECPNWTEMNQSAKVWGQDTACTIPGTSLLNARGKLS